MHQLYFREHHLCSEVLDQCQYTLALLKAVIRRNPLIGSRSYIREDAEDDRFSHRFGSLQAIITSTGENGSGL